MREFVLVRETIPGLQKSHNLLTWSDEPVQHTDLLDRVHCQIWEGFKIDPVNGLPDSDEPRIIVYVMDLLSGEIAAADREAARHYILQAGDAFSDPPLLAPEQESVVCFKDERDGEYFWS